MIDTIASVAAARTARAPSSARPAPANEPAAGGSFATTLAGLAEQAGSSLRAGEAVALAGAKGEVSTQKVVEGILAAERTLQATIAIRDKVVAAYLDISRMSI